MSSELVYFFSDAHLGQGDAPDEERKVARLESFLGHVRAHPGRVYLNGDLFDFWFEYRHAVPRGHFRILSALDATRRAGVPMVYVGGNHDFWVGDFMERELGIELRREALDLRLQGRRIFLAHGDGLLRGERSYHALKAIFRFPPNIWLFRWLHPDVGIPLALGWSRASHRKHHRHRPPPLERIRREIAEPRFAEGFDAVVLGHFHFPAHLQPAGRDLIVLGDWVKDFTFATLQDGRFQLWKWNEESPPMPVAPSAVQQGEDPQRPR